MPGFSPVAEEGVVLVGARAIDTPGEERRLAASDVAVVGADRIESGGWAPSVQRWAG